MLWRHKNIEARIWPLDHCPPHVTFVCRADEWSARLEFSMVTTKVSLLDIKPMKNAPGKSLIDALASQLLANLQICRETWWEAQGTACLDNKNVERIPSGSIVLASGPARARSNAGTVVPKSDRYDSRVGVEAKIKWSDGTTTREIFAG
jgi:hypothetical protein